MVPNKAKQLLLILKGAWLFITEVIYLYGTCFRGIFEKRRLSGRAFFPMWSVSALLSPLQPSIALNEKAWPTGALSRCGWASALEPPRPPYGTLRNGGGSTLSLGFAPTSQETGGFPMLWNHLISWNVLNRPRTKARCIGTFLGIKRGYSGSDLAAEHNGFGKVALGRLRVLGFPGLCAKELFLLGEGLKMAWTESVGVHTSAGALGPSQWACWAHSGKDVEITLLSALRERGLLPGSLFLNSHEIMVARTKEISET